MLSVEAHIASKMQVDAVFGDLQVLRGARLSLLRMFSIETLALDYRISGDTCVNIAKLCCNSATHQNRGHLANALAKRPVLPTSRMFPIDFLFDGLKPAPVRSLSDVCGSF